MNEVGRNVRTLQDSSILRARVYRRPCKGADTRSLHSPRNKKGAVCRGRKERNGECETAWKDRRKFEGEVIPLRSSEYLLTICTVKERKRERGNERETNPSHLSDCVCMSAAPTRTLRNVNHPWDSGRHLQPLCRVLVYALWGF